LEVEQLSDPKDLTDLREVSRFNAESKVLDALSFDLPLMGNKPEN